MKNIIKDQIQPPKQSIQKNQNIQTYKSFRYLVALVLTYSLGSFYFGYIIAYISSISFDTIREVFSVDWEMSLSQGLIIGSVPVGALIGSSSSGFFISKFSRRKVIISTNLLALLVGSLIYIQNSYVLVLTRLVQGFCLGIYSSLVPLIVHEFSPIQIAGRLGSFHQLFIFIGTFVAFLFKYICQVIADDLPGKKIWYYVFGLPLVTISLQTLLLLFKFTYNTPKYLIKKHKHIAAHKVLRKIYKPQHVQQQYQLILQDLGIKHHEIPEHQRIYGHEGIQIKFMKKQELKRNQKQMRDQIFGTQTAIRLKSQNNKQNINQDDNDDDDLDGQNQVCQSIGNEQEQNLPTPTRAKFLAIFVASLPTLSGLNAVIAYTGQVVFKVTPQIVSIFPIIINFLPVVTNFIISFFLHRFGRKTLLLFGAAVACVSTGLIGVGFFISYDSNTTAGTVLIYGSQIIYMSNFGLTIGPIVWLYLSEIATEDFMPYAVAANWIGASIVIIFFPIIKASLPHENPAPLFIFFSVFSLLSLIVTAKFAIQTKDKSFKQIYKQFQKIEQKQKQLRQEKQKQRKEQKKLQKQVKNEKNGQNVDLNEKQNKGQVISVSSLQTK